MINKLTHTVTINLGAIRTSNDVNIVSRVKMGFEAYIMVGSRAVITSKKLLLWLLFESHSSPMPSHSAIPL